MLFDAGRWPKKSLSLTLLTFIERDVFLLHVVLFQLIGLSSFQHVGSPIEQEMDAFFGRDKIIKMNSFETSLSMRTTSINTGAITFLLSTCCKEASTITIASCSLKKIHECSLEAMGEVFTRSHYTGFPIEISTRVKTGRNHLTHGVGVLLAGIIANDRFVNVCPVSRNFFNQ